MKFLVSITIAALLAAAGLAAAYGVGPEGQGLPPDQKEAATALRAIGANFRIIGGKVLGMNAYDAGLTDEQLALVARFRDLEDLDLFTARITDAGLEDLTGLTKLQYLRLEGTAITDAGLEAVGRIESLKSLSLGSTNVTGTGLEHLKPLKHLESLGLGRTQVGDDGMVYLAGHSRPAAAGPERQGHRGRAGVVGGADQSRAAEHASWPWRR